MINDDVFEKHSIDFENSLNKQFKKNNGIFYTDIELSGSMIDFLNIPKDASIIDPCCGTGSFVYSLMIRGYKKVYGCDFDSKTVKKCIELTKSRKIRCIDTIGLPGEDILKKIRHAKFDFVIGNPPYVPMTKGVSINCDSNFNSLVKNSGGNMFVAAIYRAFELAKEDGFISIIVPKNLLHISSYKQIRRRILREKQIVSIVELGIHFKSVRGEQIILTLKNSYVEDNVIKFYKYKNGYMVFLSEVNQKEYENEIIVFEKKEDILMYHKLKKSYDQLGELCAENIKRGRNKDKDAIRGKQIRKFGFKDLEVPSEGNRIFIQNIFSAEAGITASFGGNLEPAETVTIIKLESIKMCKYVLGLLHSRLCNYFLIRFGFNNSRLTIHTDAKYLNDIPIVVDSYSFEKVIEIVNLMEKVKYMSNEWFEFNEELNDVVYKIYSLNSNDRRHIEREMKKISADKWYNTNSYSI